MKAITPKGRARGVAKRWKAEYLDHPKHYDTLWHQEVYDAIVALGDSPEPEDINRIIGNEYWTRPEPCSECKATVALVVQVGEEPDYESHTAWLCVNCLRAAIQAAETVAE